MATCYMEEYMKFVRQLTLIIVEECNLNCTYCYEKHKKNSKMTFETAKEIIDKEFINISDNDYLQIEFFGGEPFLNFKLIKDVVNYVEKNYPKHAIYNTTTNGTVITDEVKTWLYEHKHHFFAALSLDGTKEMHDRNRQYYNMSGSYDDIDIDFFLSLYDEVSVKMTIAPNALNGMADGIIELLEKGFKVDATLALGNVDWSAKTNVNIFLEQLQILIEYYKNHPDYQIVRMLNLPVEAILYEQTETTRYCGAGKNIHCYTGNDLFWTPCQGFSRVTIGEDYKKYIGEDFEGYIEPDGICKTCKVSSLCSKCWGTNLATTGSIDETNSWICVLNRIIMIAGARILYDRITQKQEFTEDDQRKLKVIQIVLNEAFNKDNIYLRDYKID